MRWLWRGVLAMDRIGSRVPQLVQMLVVEFAIMLCLSGFIAKVIDVYGAWGCPPSDYPLDGTFWTALVIALVFLGFFGRNVFWPRLVQGSWTPIQTATIGNVGILVPNRSWTAHYTYLTSHPSYVLLLLPVSWLPLLTLWATEGQGCSYFYNRMMGWAGVWIILAMALCRLVAWYVLRLGRARLRNAAAEGMSEARLGWEIAWKPVLMLMVIMHAVTVIPIAVMFWQVERVHAALPLATIADVDVAGEFRRVAGTVKGDLVVWPPGGMGRGSNNFYGGGILMDMDGGGEALLLAGASALPDLRAAISGASNGHIEMIGRLGGSAISENNQRYGHMTEADFPPRPTEGRVIIEVGQYP